MSLEEAVNKSINECLKDNILTDFLNKNRREIVGLSIFEYDEEKELELLKKDQFEYGMEKGIEKGMEKGIHFTLTKLIQNGLITMKDAAVHFNMSESEFQKLIENNETTEFN